MTVTYYERGRNRVLAAANLVDTADPEEAAVVGAIARSLLRLRRFDPHDIALEAQRFIVHEAPAGRPLIPPARLAELTEPKALHPVVDKFSDAYRKVSLPW